MAGPQQWGCMNCYIMDFFWKLDIGNCELADGTMFERSGYCFTSCRANMGSSVTAFSPSFANAVEDSLPGVSHALFCTVRVFIV